MLKYSALPKFEEICVVILAGGKGTRMKQSLPKVLLPLLEKPIIFWTLDLINKLKIKNIIIVTGYQASQVEKEIARGGYKAGFMRQVKPLGTANALKIALKRVDKKIKNVFVVYGDDSALYRPQTINDFLNFHIVNDNNFSIITYPFDDSFNIGGIKVDKNGRVKGIFQVKDTSLVENNNLKILCGAMCFKKSWLQKNIGNIKKGERSGEYPLPYLIDLASQSNDYVYGFELKDVNEWNSINTQEELLEAEAKKKRQN